jgi:SSS family transporter
MNLLTSTEVLMLIVCYGIALITIVWLVTHTEGHAEGFLAADRKVPVWRGALSIAVSWVWAPAIFVCSLQAYTKGLPGIFWFTAPNILCFFIFTPLGIRLRKLLPLGYTLPDFIRRRFSDDKSVHVAFLTVFFGYQLGAIIINTLAGGTLLHTISGINIHLAIVAMALIALSYTLLSGLKASILTDVIQMVMLLGIAFILVPWCVIKSGGWSTVQAGLGGVTGAHRSLFDPWIAFSMGIPMTLALISGPIGDQVFFQRAMAVRQKDIAKTFIYGGLLFGIVPITLSLLGFIGAAEANRGMITVADPQVVGPIVVATLLPKFALYAFTLMAFAGLCSTLDSSLCAISSLGGVDIYKQYVNPNSSESNVVLAARISMVAMTIVGTTIALCQPKLLWCFLAYGALASAGLFPTIFALYWKRLSARGAFWAVVLSLVFGTPLSIYANITENPYLIVAAAVLSVSIGLVVCIISGLLNRNPDFDYSSLKRSYSSLDQEESHGQPVAQPAYEKAPK